MSPQYVFIVGLPRTGSKLMVNILENCHNKHCVITPENFFLGRFLRAGVRDKMKKIGDMNIDTNVQKFVDNIYAGKFTVFSGDHWSHFADGTLGVEKEVLTQRILESDRSDKAIYAILLQIHTQVTDNTIVGDKTGPHLYRVPTLLSWFPEAKIVHTFRDPRAVLASEHRKQLQKIRRRTKKAQEAGDTRQVIWYKLKEPIASLGIVFYITIAWLYAVRLHYKYKNAYPNNYYLSKFEDVVNTPEETIQKICEFLDIEFHSMMLNPPKVDSSFAPKGGTGFNVQSLNKWEGYLKPWMKKWMLWWGAKQLREFGYIR